MEPTSPIYEYIKTHTKEGRLPEDFSIPWIEDAWAPGAHDGVFLKHMAPVESVPDEDRDRRILRALTLTAAEDSLDHIEELFGLLEEIDEKTTVVRLYDEIQRIVYENQDQMDLMNLLNFGDWLISTGVSLLAVKWGLSVIAGFDAPFVGEVATEFGVYEEFTYYAARILSQRIRENGNDELFSLAQNTRGWGRIHAVDYLRAETQEIRDWLLYNGADNTVIPQYSADVCLQKAEAGKRLESSLSAEEYKAIGQLIGYTLEPGPCPGLTDGERILSLYLAKAKEYPADRELIRKILEKAEDYRLGPDAAETARQILEQTEE